MVDDVKCDSNKVMETAYDYDVLSADKKLLDYYQTALSHGTMNSKKRKILEGQFSQLSSSKTETDRLRIRYKDIVFLHGCLKSVNKG